MVAEYDGTAPAAKSVGGGGNRAAYLLAQQSTADPTRHAVIEGKAPAGAVLRIEKTVQTPTSPQPDETGEPILLEDHLSSKLTVPDSGKYEWHINPSTRPLVAQEQGRPAIGTSSASIPFRTIRGPSPPSDRTPAGSAARLTSAPCPCFCSPSCCCRSPSCS